MTENTTPPVGLPEPPARYTFTRRRQAQTVAATAAIVSVGVLAAWLTGNALFGILAGVTLGLVLAIVLNSLWTMEHNSAVTKTLLSREANAARWNPAPTVPTAQVTAKVDKDTITDALAPVTSAAARIEQNLTTIADQAAQRTAATLVDALAPHNMRIDPVALAATASRPLPPKQNPVNLIGRAHADDPYPHDGRPKVKVAVILDEFTHNSFRFEFDPVILHPSTWQEQFEREQPAVFFCESAWSGADSHVRPWKGRVYASKNFPTENRGALLDILAYCKQHGIPTVFWNKEDPSHYGDKVHDFVRTAVLFDHVLTTDAGCVDRYRIEQGHPSVGVLQFAAQPHLFNPVNNTQRTDAVTFAGGWYTNHVARSRAMERFLNEVVATGQELVIYDRYFHDTDPLHKYPEQFHPYLLPPVPHAQLADVYKASRYGLTINTETRSTTMFARRIYELMASNTFVVSNHSVGIDRDFSPHVHFFDKSDRRLADWTDEEVDTARAVNLERVLTDHTYRNRWNSILDLVGLPDEKHTLTTTLLMPVFHGDDSELARCVDIAGRYAGRTDTVNLLLMPSVTPVHVPDVYRKAHRLGLGAAPLAQVADGTILSGSLVPKNRFTVLDPNNPLSVDDLDRCILHSQYVHDPVIPAGFHDPYTYTLTTPQLNVVADRAAFRPFLTALHAQTTKDTHVAHYSA